MAHLRRVESGNVMSLIKANLLLLSMIGILLFFGLKNLRLTIIILILLLDFLKTFLLTKYKLIFPLDFGLFAVILFGYAGLPHYSFFILPFVLLNRFINGLSKPTYLIKFPLLVFMSYSAYFLNFVYLGGLGSILIVARYALEYILEAVLFGKMSSADLFRRALHTIFAYFFYSTIGVLILRIIV